MGNQGRFGDGDDIFARLSTPRNLHGKEKLIWSSARQTSKSARRGGEMNLYNALVPIWFIVCAAGGALLGHSLAQKPIIGLAVGGILGVAPLILLGVANVFMMAWRPDRPECRCGECSSQDYEYIGPHQRMTDDATYMYRCPRCGRRYRSRGMRFSEVLADDTESSYMRASRWGRWVKDEADAG